MIKMTSTADALTTALATYRLTKLVIDDEITQELRMKAYQEIDKLPPKLANKLSYFLGCPWCVSIWAAGFLVLLKKVAPNLHELLTTILSASAVTGIIASRV